MPLRDTLPTPFNLSGVEWLDCAISKMKQILNADETTDLLDIYDDLQNCRTLLVGEHKN